MELGIEGRRAIVCAASRGLGLACATALAREGVHVVINGRDAAALDAAAEAIRQEAPNVSVTQVAGDIADPATRQALVEVGGAPDILVNNAGGPPPGNFRDWSRDTWIQALDTNMLSAIELIRLVIDPMAERGFGRIINITSSTVRVPIPVLGLSNAMRSGLANFVLGLVPSVSAKGVTINNILPGPFDTKRLRPSADTGRPMAPNPVAGRVGRPEELGAICTFLASAHAGYLTGQNIMIDGGLFPGSF